MNAPGTPQYCSTYCTVCRAHVGPDKVAMYSAIHPAQLQMAANQRLRLHPAPAILRNCVSMHIFCQSWSSHNGTITAAEKLRRRLPRSMLSRRGTGGVRRNQPVSALWHAASPIFATVLGDPRESALALSIPMICDWSCGLARWPRALSLVVADQWQVPCIGMRPTWRIFACLSTVVG